jgi:RNA polymerase sigma-70 factor (ECF subfamily)
VLLERLTPVERAVFLLRQVFEYEYSEIATILDQSEANCRQLLRRARQHISATRPRFKASARKQSDLLKRFLHAAESGDLNGLVKLLSDDVELHSDGGGKAIAMPNLVRGTEKVARGVVGALRKFVPKEVVRHVTQINGTPGIVSYLNGKPFSVVSFDESEGRIRAIYVVTNPEKLAHVPPMPAAEE